MMRVFGLSATFRLPLKFPTSAEALLGSPASGSGARSIDGDGRGLSGKLGAAIQIEFADHLHGQKIALQNFNFCFEFGGIVVVETERGRVLEIEAGIRLVDFDRATCFVHRRHLQAGDGDDYKNRDQNSR